MRGVHRAAASEAQGKSSGRFSTMDGVRAVGALMVLTTHVGFGSGAALNSAFNGVLSRMDSGVAIFFVISGFLLFLPHVTAWATGGQRPAVGPYAWHRILRIVPALWLAVAASALFLQHNRQGVAPYIRHATFTQIYSTGNETYGLTQMWSLSTEVAFYAALPVLGWATTRGVATTRGFKVRIAVLSLTPILGATWMGVSAARGQALWALWLPGFVGWFGMGMLLAVWFVGRRHGFIETTWVDTLAERRWTAWGLAAAVYLVATSPVAGPYRLVPATPGEAVTKNLLYAFIGLLIVMPSTVLGTPAATGSAAHLARKVGTFLGEISYGIFCYHLIVLGLVERRLDYVSFTGGFWRLWIPTVVITVVVATLSFYFFERPIMRRGRRIRWRTTLGANTGSTDMTTATRAST